MSSIDNVSFSSQNLQFFETFTGGTKRLAGVHLGIAESAFGALILAFFRTSYLTSLTDFSGQWRQVFVAFATKIETIPSLTMSIPEIVGFTHLVTRLMIQESACGPDPDRLPSQK